MEEHIDESGWLLRHELLPGGNFPVPLSTTLVNAAVYMRSERPAFKSPSERRFITMRSSRSPILAPDAHRSSSRSQTSRYHKLFTNLLPRVALQKNVFAACGGLLGGQSVVEPGLKDQGQWRMEGCAYRKMQSPTMAGVERRKACLKVDIQI
jgi:hypothetical protein